MLSSQGLANNVDRIAWKKTLKDLKKEAIYDDVLVKFNIPWGGSNVLYHRSNFKIMWKKCAPNVGLVLMLRLFTMLGWFHHTHPRQFFQFFFWNLVL